MPDSPYVFAVTEQTFAARVIEQSYQCPVVVDFWANWCAPCRTLMPILAQLADEFAGQFMLAKVDTDSERELAAQYQVRSLPTVKLFQNGQPVDEFLGALPESQIREFLERYLPRESTQLLEQAKNQLSQGHLEEAVELIAQAKAIEPNNPQLAQAEAGLQIALGHFDQAEQQLQQIPLTEQNKPETALLRSQLFFAKAVADASDRNALVQQLSADPTNCQARYQLAAYQVQQQNYAEALENLLKILRQDLNFNDQAARKAMLAIFALLEDTSDLVKRYRSQLFNLLH